MCILEQQKLLLNLINSQIVIVTAQVGRSDPDAAKLTQRHVGVRGSSRTKD